MDSKFDNIFIRPHIKYVITEEVNSLLKDQSWLVIVLSSHSDGRSVREERKMTLSAATLCNFLIL